MLKADKLISRVGGGYTFFAKFLEMHVEKLIDEPILVQRKIDLEYHSEPATLIEPIMLPALVNCVDTKIYDFYRDDKKS